MRFTAATYNVWNTERWPQRRAPLVDFLRRHSPDVLALQEVRPEGLASIQEALPGHRHVTDSNPIGWQTEGNIFWNADLFQCIEFGASAVGIAEPDRRLFWARLQSTSARVPTLLVSTAHLTWRETRAEAESGMNPRLPQIRSVIARLSELRQDPEEPALFMGDLNDSLHVLHQLKAAGYQEVFEALGRTPVPTWPVPGWPADLVEPGIPELDDWIFFRGGITPMAVDVPDFYLNGVAPSDHRAVIACFRAG